MESKVVVPAEGKKITLQNGKINVPHNPIIPFIEGDGIGVDVTPAMLKVVDAAVEKAYKGERKISGWKFTPVKNRLKFMAGRLAASRNAGPDPRLSRCYQRPSDHASWRRHSLPERGAASGTGSVCVSASGALLPWHPKPG